MKVILNGKEIETTEAILSHNDIASLANNSPQGLLITYRCPSGRGGTIHPWVSVQVEEGMVINVEWVLVQ